MADIVFKQNDLQSNVLETLQKSSQNVSDTLDFSLNRIETANEGYQAAVKNSSGTINNASTDILDALTKKKELAETPRIVKGIMTILGFEDYNENYQNLRIQEGNAKMGVAAKRLDAAGKARDIAVESAKFRADNAVREHAITRQSLFDPFALSANINEEQKRQLAGASDKALNEWKTNPGAAPEWIQNKRGLIDEELRKRAGSKADLTQKQYANEIARIRTKDAQVRSTLDDLTDEQIGQIKTGKMKMPEGLTQQDVEKEARTRESVLLSLNAARQAAELNDLRMHELYKTEAMQKMSSNQLKLLSEQAKARGGTIKIDKVAFTEAELVSMYTAKLQSEDEMYKKIVAHQQEVASLGARANVVDTKLNNLRNASGFVNPNGEKILEPDQEAKMQEVLGAVEVAKASNQPTAIAEALKVAEEAAEQIEKEMVEQAPQTEKGARQEYINTGQVRKPENAFTLLGDALSSPELLADNSILGPVYRETGQIYAAYKTRHAEGVTMGSVLSGRGGEGGTGIADNFYLSQPKKLEDDQAVQKALQDADARQKLGNALTQKMLARQLGSMDNAMASQGLESPFSKFIMSFDDNRDGVPDRFEFRDSMYQVVPVDPEDPTGPKKRQFNPKVMLEELAAMSIRDHKLGKLPPGENYLSQLLNGIRENSRAYISEFNSELHGDPYASAFTNLISGGRLYPLIDPLLQNLQIRAGEALQVGQALQSRMEEQHDFLAKYPEMIQTPEEVAQHGKSLTKITPDELSSMLKERMSGGESIQGIIDILRQGNKPVARPDDIPAVTVPNGRN